MLEKKVNSLMLWEFTNLSQFSPVAHFISGRVGGTSSGELGGLNLSFRVNDERVHVIENRRRLAEAMGVNPARLIFPAQTHSNNVSVVDRNTHEKDLEDTDALITREKGILISVMSADCVPILLYDSENKAVGAIHAGWRGSVGKILTSTIKAMGENFGTKPQNIVAGIGPSICQEVYEVGEDVFSEVKKTFGSKPEILMQKERPDKAYINLWEINKLQLIEAGVPEDAIEVAGICTYKNDHLFFSARKSGNRAGRFAAGIMIRDE